MIIPVRCFSCNNPISRHYLEYLKHVEEEKNIREFFDKKKIKKYCCRRMLLTHVDTYKIIKKVPVGSK